MLRAISYQYLYRVWFQWQFCICTCRAQQDIRTNDHVPQVRFFSKARLPLDGFRKMTLRPTRRSSLGWLNSFETSSLRLRLKENFDRFNFANSQGEGNGRFSQSNYCASRARPVYRAGQRAGWRFRSAQLTCNTNVTVTPHCVVKVTPNRLVTSPSPAPAASLDRAGRRRFRWSTLRCSTTPRSPAACWTLGTADVATSEALLLIDEPGSGLPGYGPSLPQSALHHPADGLRGVGWHQVAGGTFNTTVRLRERTAPVRSAPTCIRASCRRQLAVTFFGVPVLPPTTTGSRVFRITNVRVNATASGWRFRFGRFAGSGVDLDQPAQRRSSIRTRPRTSAT